MKVEETDKDESDQKMTKKPISSGKPETSYDEEINISSNYDEPEGRKGNHGNQ